MLVSLSFNTHFGKRLGTAGKVCPPGQSLPEAVLAWEISGLVYTPEELRQQRLPSSTKYGLPSPIPQKFKKSAVLRKEVPIPSKVQQLMRNRQQLRSIVFKRLPGLDACAYWSYLDSLFSGRYKVEDEAQATYLPRLRQRVRNAGRGPVKNVIDPSRVDIESLCDKVSGLPVDRKVKAVLAGLMFDRKAIADRLGFISTFSKARAITVSKNSRTKSYKAFSKYDAKFLELPSNWAKPSPANDTQEAKAVFKEMGNVQRVVFTHYCKLAEYGDSKENRKERVQELTQQLNAKYRTTFKEITVLRTITAVLGELKPNKQKVLPQRVEALPSQEWSFPDNLQYVDADTARLLWQTRLDDRERQLFAAYAAARSQKQSGEDIGSVFKAMQQQLKKEGVVLSVASLPLRISRIAKKLGLQREKSSLKRRQNADNEKLSSSCQQVPKNWKKLSLLGKNTPESIEEAFKQLNSRQRIFFTAVCDAQRKHGDAYNHRQVLAAMASFAPTMLSVPDTELKQKSMLNRVRVALGISRKKNTARTQALRKCRTQFKELPQQWRVLVQQQGISTPAGNKILESFKQLTPVNRAVTTAYCATHKAGEALDASKLRRWFNRRKIPVPVKDFRHALSAVREKLGLGKSSRAGARASYARFNVENQSTQFAPPSNWSNLLPDRCDVSQKVLDRRFNELNPANKALVLAVCESPKPGWHQHMFEPVSHYLARKGWDIGLKKAHLNSNVYQLRKRLGLL